MLNETSCGSVFPEGSTGYPSPSFRVLGVRVDAVQIPDVIARMERWIDRRESRHVIAVTGMHGVTESRRDPHFKRVLNQADLVVPDGMPLIWIGRHRGHALRRRVYGPELMIEFCQSTASKRYSHYFYGGVPGIANQLAGEFRRRFSGLRVAGAESPPFRSLSDTELREVRHRINQARPDVLWVGLGCPKQELWMENNRNYLEVPVMVGVGAAFDIHGGRVRQAPMWLRERGLEWSWRLLQNPRRLWKRYLIRGPRFLWEVGLDLAGLRQFE